ncbi:MAG: hypothetical protein UT30_C0002G0057 [Candidatus Uhrbacteria bacterium GW2011_GWF2_39_13]|uniref:PspA/IM30 family protein n=1 Tax=Candidatus Uhrbacteria bacterium GW2011_GWF2_39_13 TaxID=1618995 RepID=A0A0G0Q3D7_9BACT|nr:MAG: hypothetical protein UT30_C0002G0057 [Candidatus Uhrbacteria bacterium GW2011_GWF2_39_13]HAU66145.1 hypothetical protein [Candidatus Uhrbacteria bacterium]
MAFFGSIGRSWKIFWLRITGKVDEANKLMMKDPTTIKAVYAEEGEKIGKMLNQAAEAVATVIHEQEKLKRTKVTKTEELARSKRVMQGAMAAAKKRSTELQTAGKSLEEIKVDPDFMRHQAAYVDSQSTVKEREEYLVQLDRDIETYQKQVEQAKTTMVSLQREQGKLQGEAAEMAARMIGAENRKRIASLTAGLSMDGGTAKLRADVRDLVGQAEAQARVTEELAGTNANKAEDEYLAYATNSVAQDDFLAQLGLAEKVETRPSATVTNALQAEKLS